jgi:hypothetical protein
MTLQIVIAAKNNTISISFFEKTRTGRKSAIIYHLAELSTLDMSRMQLSGN